MRHASDYHAKGPPDLGVVVCEVNMVVSDVSDAVSSVPSSRLYVYDSFSGRGYAVCMYIIWSQGRNKSTVVSPKAARFRKSNQSIDASSGGGLILSRYCMKS